MVQFAYSLASGTKGVEHENKNVGKQLSFPPPSAIFVYAREKSLKHLC